MIETVVTDEAEQPERLKKADWPEAAEAEAARKLKRISYSRSS